MEIGVRLTVVANQFEADATCSVLRANGIRCGERAAPSDILGSGGFGDWREILVAEGDLEAAQELLAAMDPPEAPPPDPA